MQAAGDRTPPAPAPRACRPPSPVVRASSGPCQVVRVPSRRRGDPRPRLRPVHRPRAWSDRRDLLRRRRPGAWEVELHDAGRPLFPGAGVLIVLAHGVRSRADLPVPFAPVLLVASPEAARRRCEASASGPHQRRRRPAGHPRRWPGGGVGGGAARPRAHPSRSWPRRPRPGWAPRCGDRRHHVAPMVTTLAPCWATMLAP